MKTLSILSVILLLSCSSSKNMEEQGNLQNRKNKYQTVKGQISVHYSYFYYMEHKNKETDIFFPANIVIYAKKDSIAGTKSDNKGLFTFKLKRKYLDRKLHAVITPKKDRIIKRIVTYPHGAGYTDAVAVFKKNGVFIKDTIPFQITESDTSHLQWHFKNCEVNETTSMVKQ